MIQEDAIPVNGDSIPLEELAIMHRSSTAQILHLLENVGEGEIFISFGEGEQRISTHFRIDESIKHQIKEYADLGLTDPAKLIARKLLESLCLNQLTNKYKK